MAAKSSAPRKVHALITGPPGIGKTTLVRNVCQKLQEEMSSSLHLHGFYTEEVREGGTSRSGRGLRIGFDVVTFEGCRGPLARVIVERSSQGAHRDNLRPFVGKYCVHLESFERLALPTLNTDNVLTSKSPDSGPGHHLYVVDEIGKMELFSHNFVHGVKALFQKDGGLVVMATIPVARQKCQWLVEELRKRDDCLLYEVNEMNRDNLVSEISKFLRDRLICKPV